MSPFAQLVPHVLRFRRQFAVGLLCLVLTTALSLAGPWVLRYAIDDLTAHVTRGKLGLYAGLLLGLAEAYTAGYISSDYKDAVPFVLILVILFFLPNGLLGSRAVERV